MSDSDAAVKAEIDAAARADLEALVLRIERHFKARTFAAYTAPGIDRTSFPA